MSKTNAMGEVLLSVKLKKKISWRFLFIIITSQLAREFKKKHIYRLNKNVFLVSGASQDKLELLENPTAL